MMSSQQHGGILYRNSQGEQIDSEQVQSLNRHRLSTIDLQPMLVKQQQEREKISPNCSLVQSLLIYTLIAFLTIELY